MNSTSKTIVLIGVVIILVGLLWNFLPLGKLPGDIHIKRENTQVFIPITTSILLSILLSVIFYFTRR